MPDATSASAPGRVTILGEHTDYNAGTALAVATAERTTATVERRADGVVVIDSDALGTVACELADPAGPPFARLATELARAAKLHGARVEVRSDVPVGAGISSSAAYAVSVALAMGLEGTALELARRCQDAERAAGADVGLLDQLVALGARGGHAIHLDFHRLVHTAVPIHDAVGLSVVDTGVRRDVAATAYARRRSECAAAAARIGELGLARPDDLGALEDPVLLRRARHVVTECVRVAAGTEALRDGQLEVLGSLLDEGHASLRDDFAASTPQVEAARDALRAMPGVAGVRLCGAGFGGCLVVAHDPACEPRLEGRWGSRLRGGDPAALSSSR